MLCAERRIRLSGINFQSISTLHDMLDNIWEWMESTGATSSLGFDAEGLYRDQLACNHDAAVRQPPVST